MEIKKTGIMGNLENTLATLRGIHSALLNPKNTENKAYWAVGGLVVCIVSQVTKIVTDVILSHKKTSATDADAKADLAEIKAQINDFLDSMVNHE